MPKTISLVCLLLAFASLPASAESLAGLKKKMDAVATGFHGVLGYSLHYRGKPEERIEFQADVLFPTASTIKTAIMCEAMHQVDEGKLKWGQEIVVQPGLDDREEGGFAYFFRDGSSMPLPYWLDLMVRLSDNTATIRLRDLLGQENVNTWLKDHGFQHTLLLNGKDTDRLKLRSLQQQYGLGMTTPHEMARLFELIRDNQAGSPASCDRMLRILTHQYWDDGISSQVPPEIHTASKSGALDESRSDVALVDSPGGEYVLAVYTKDIKDTRWARDNEANAAIRTLSQLVWQHYNPRSHWTPPPGAENLLPTS